MHLFAHRLRVLLHVEVKIVPFQNPARWVGFFYVAPLPPKRKKAHGSHLLAKALTMFLSCYRMLRIQRCDLHHRNV